LIFVAEITLAIDGSGTEQTWYFSSGRGWATGASDTPSKTYISNGLMGAGRYRREMFAGDGLFGPVRSAFGALTLNNADGSLDGWRTHGFDGRRVRVYMGEEEGLPYPSGYTLVFEARMLRASIGMRTVEVVLRDRMTDLDAPMCTTSLLGTGGLQGKSDLAGRTIPRCIGFPFLVPAVLVEPTKNIYLVHAYSASSGANTAYSSGGAVVNESDYADTATLLSTAPSASRARWYVGGPTYVRLQTPAANVQMSVGQPNTSSGAAPSFEAFVQEAGVVGATSSLVAPGWYVDDASTTYLDVLARETRVRPCWFGFDRSMNFVGELIADPADGTPVAEITQWDVLSVERSAPPGFEVPVWRVATRGRRNFADRSGLAVGADPITRMDYYRSESVEDASLLAKHPYAKTLAADAGNFYPGGAAEFLALHKEDRDLMTVRLPLTTTTAAYDLGDVLTLRHPRFGLSAGKQFLVVAVEIDIDRAQVQFSLWG